MNDRQKLAHLAQRYPTLAAYYRYELDRHVAMLDQAVRFPLVHAAVMERLQGIRTKLNSEISRQCTNCKQYLLPVRFTNDRNRCKACDSARVSRYYHRRKEAA